MHDHLVAFLTWLLRKLSPRYRSICFVISDGVTTHEAKHMKTTINDTQKFLLSIALASAAGNASAPAGVPTWTTSDMSIATVTPAPDGLSAEVSSAGAIGSATITAFVDGLTATDEITVIGGPAATLTLTAGAPEPLIHAV